MKTELYAAVYAAEFPAQALLRAHAELQSEALVVLEGRAPLESVCSLNRAARMKGVVPGLTRLEAESVAGLRLLARSQKTEAVAEQVLLEAAAHYSPRIELATQDYACACVLDIAGMERLFGPPLMLAERLRGALAEVGLRVSIVVSDHFHAALLKAAYSRGVTVIPAGQEAAALAKLPVSALSLPADAEETFALWGIRTLGELGALPEDELVSRLGAKAVSWRNLALGIEPHAFQPIEPEFALREFIAFETPVEQSDALLFSGARMIDCLTGRASARALSLASLMMEMKLDGGLEYQRTIRPALPTTDRKFLLKLLQLELGAHPPQAAVLSFTLSAEAGQASKMQLGLFAPPAPEPSRLDVTLARLKAIAGEDRVGSPVLEDSHRPGSFRMESFRVPAEAAGALSADLAHIRPKMALRRMRPPTAVRVQLAGLQPEAFRDREQSFQVLAAYGPWRSSGAWWSSNGWNAEEWDVLAENQTGTSVACLLVRDCARNDWRLEAYYD